MNEPPRRRISPACPRPHGTVRRDDRAIGDIAGVLRDGAELSLATSTASVRVCRRETTMCLRYAHPVWRERSRTRRAGVRLSFEEKQAVGPGAPGSCSRGAISVKRSAAWCGGGYALEDVGDCEAALRRLFVARSISSCLPSTCVSFNPRHLVAGEDEEGWSRCGSSRTAHESPRRFPRTSHRRSRR